MTGDGGGRGVGDEGNRRWARERGEGQGGRRGLENGDSLYIVPCD